MCAGSRAARCRAARWFVLSLLSTRSLALAPPAAAGPAGAIVSLPRRSAGGRCAATSGDSTLQLSAMDPRVVSVTLDKVTGIDFGCDLSLCWPYVLSLTPGGAAERLGELRVGDQLLTVSGESVVGRPVAEAMSAIAAAEGLQVSMVFFRGSRESLQALCDVARGPATVTLTLQRPGQPDEVLSLPYGCNLRDELVKRKINVYQSLTRWTNCNGKQLCGTCIVDVPEGVESCTRRSLDEASTLRENPPTYKLACITNLYGDATVKLMPKVNPAQWTR